MPDPLCRLSVQHGPHTVDVALPRETPVGLLLPSIVDLVHRYSYCVDHRLYDEVVDLFTEDCTVDYGPGIAPIRGRAALRTMLGHPSAYRATIATF